MKKRCIMLVLLLASLKMFSQANAWSAVLPARFPINNTGQINGISRVSQMKFHPTDPNKMYAMSARGGLFISLNGGNSWAVAPGTDFMPDNRLASVCIDFTNDSIIYIGTGDHDYYYGGSGVWKSVNGGQTFTQTTLNTGLIVEMAMDPLDHNTIVAATDRGIFKTIDGGNTWALKTAADIQFDDLKKVEFATSRTLFAATNDSVLYRSYDFGDTWMQLTNGIQLPDGITAGDGCRIALTPADTNIIYLAMVTVGGTIFKSVDGGNSFTTIKSSGAPYLTYYDDTVTSSTQGDYNFSIGVDRTDPNILYMVAHTTWRSLDGGVSWSQLTHWYEKVHTDMHQITVSPYNPHQLWNMNDGGVWLSTDTGNTWAPKSDGLVGEEIYHGNCSPTRRDMISIGTQDNGELYADSTGWYTNRGGDWGPECAFDYRPNSNVVYYFDDVMRRSVFGGDNGFGLPVYKIEAMAFNRLGAQIAFAADSAIYRSNDLLDDNPTWTMINGVNKDVMALHSDLSDTNRLYFITSDAKFYTSRNAMAATPVFVQTSLPHTANLAAGITSIKGKRGVVYAFCNNRVYRSADTGTTWANVSYNLSTTNIVSILSDEFYPDSEMVFVASSNAVYYKKKSQTAWTIFSNSLPDRPSIVDMSVYNDSTSDAVLRIALYGRGMWQIPIAPLRPLHASLEADNTNGCKGIPITFSDVSNGVVTSRRWSFPGGSPTNSTALNPVVTYNAYGTYTVSLTVYNGNDSSTETRNLYIAVNAGVPLNVSEGFEGSVFPPAGWSAWDVNGDGYSWQWYNSAGGYGNSDACMYFDNFNNNAGGKYNDLLTPKCNLTGYPNMQLTFDHAYQLYGDTTEIDTMEVLISTDCGTTFNTIYKQGGAQFATVPGTGSYTNPSPGDWRTDTVNVTSFAGTSAIFDFRSIGHYGNDIFVDNINIDGNPVSSIKNIPVDEGRFLNVYPDPLTAGNWQVTVSDAFIDGQLQLYDAQGKLVYTAQITANHTEVTANLAAGIYLFRVSNAGGSIVKRVVKL